MARTIVVGGGPAGMSCALTLADGGHDVVVLEGEAEAGGKVRTLRPDADAEWRVETGPAAILDDAPATQSLLDRLNLRAEIVRAEPAAKRRYLQRGGQLVALPDKPPLILTTPLLSLRGKLRLLAEPFSRRATDEDESVAAFGRRHLGAEVVQELLQPMVSGVFAGDVEKLSLPSAFPRLAAMEREHRSLLRGAIVSERERKKSGRERAQMMSLQGGLGAISAALAQTLGTRLHTGARVEQIRRDGGQWRVSTAENHGEEIVGDRLVLAIPESAARALLAPVDAALADELAGISSVPVAAVCLGFTRADVPRALDGVGCLLSPHEGSPLLGVLWMTSIFAPHPGDRQAPAGSVLLRGLFGGALHRSALDLDDAALVAELRVQLARTLGIERPPSFMHVQRWSQAIAQYDVGHAARLRRLRARALPLDLHFVGQAFDGIGLNDVLRDGQALGRRLRESP